MNVELFKDAIAIIAGIPESRLMLEKWQQCEDDDFPHGIIQKATQINCGTICCAGGWLALHPDMQKHGIWIASNGAIRFGNASYSSALSGLFDITSAEAGALFGQRYERDRKLGNGILLLSDRDLWLVRAMLLLRDRATFGRLLLGSLEP